MPSIAFDRRLAALAAFALIVEIWVLMSDIHFLWTPPRVPVGAVQVGEVLTVRNQARGRSPLQLSWFKLHPGNSLFEGDTVATVGDSGITIRLRDGQTVTLGANSLVVLRKTEVTNRRSFTLALLEGSLERAGTGDTQIEVGGRKVISTGPARFSVESREEGGPRISVFEGAPVRITEPPLPRLLEQFFRKETAEPPARVPVPVEVRPAMSAPKLQRPIVHKLAPAPGAREELEAPQLRRPVIKRRDDGVRGSLLRATALALAWLVTDAAAADEPRPKYSVELAWDVVPGAKSYALEIATDVKFAQKVFEKEVSAPSFSWETDAPGFYYWRAAGIAPDGKRGPFSEFMTFQLKAERNDLGDETTFDSYRPFDDYLARDHKLGFFLGTDRSRYYFSSEDPAAPPAVVVKSRTWLNGQLTYDYRISPHWGIESMIRGDRTTVGTADYEPERPAQEVLIQKENVIGLGVQRRFFRPTFFYTAHAGVRVSFVDLPVQGENGQLVYDTFGFFGLYGKVGIEGKLFSTVTGAARLGAMIQHTGNSVRGSQLAELELKLPIAGEWAFAGFWWDEILAVYRMNADTLKGHGHTLNFRPMLFFELNF